MGEYEEQGALTGAAAAENEESFEDLFDWGDDAQAEDSGEGQPAGEAGAQDGSGEDQPAAGPEGNQEEPGAGAGQEGAAAQPSGQTAPAGDEPKYKVVVYGEERELPVSELVAAAQKGMAFDTVKARWEAAQPAVQLMERYAQANHMTLGQYLEFAQAQMAQQEMKPAIDAGMPEKEAQELYRLRQEKAAQEAQRQADARRQAQVQPYLALLQAYPELQANPRLPEEVRARIARGESPLSAYRAYENDQLKAQLAAQKAAENNRRAAPGSAAGGGDREKKDAFTAGFDAGFEY